MNERIQELIKQAGYTEAYYYSDDGPFVPAEFNKEKFAELIIRECALVVYKKTGPKSALNVLEHFGVEE